MEELPFLTPKAKTREGKGLPVLHLPAWDVDVMSGATAASSLAARGSSRNHAGATPSRLLVLFLTGGT